MDQNRISLTLFLVCGFLSSLPAQVDLVFKARPLDTLAIYFPYSATNELPTVHFPNRSCTAIKHENDTVYFQVPFGAGTGKIYLVHDGMILPVAEKFHPDFDHFTWQEPTYTETFSLSHPVYFSDPCIADFNGDGLPDVALPNDNWVQGIKSPLSLLLNNSSNGNIKLELESIMLPDSQFFSVRFLNAFDLDADGDIDLLGGAQNRLVLFRNKLHQIGKMEFDFEFLDSFDLPISGLRVSDIDKNGIPEIMVSAQSDLFFLKSSGWSLPIIQKQAFNLDSTMYYELACADFNKDGFIDIVIGHSTGLTVLWGKTQLVDISTFPRQEWFVLNDGIPRYSLDAEYLYIDSIPELLTQNRGSLEKINFDHTDTGTNIIQTSYYYSYLFSGPEIVDLNFDGALEFLSRGYYYKVGTKNIYTFHDTGKISFTPLAEIPRGNDFQNWKAMSADLDTNGISEVILFNFDTYKTIEVFQKWDSDLEEKLTNKFLHQACKSDSIRLGIGKQIRRWKLTDTSIEELDSVFWLNLGSNPSVFSTPNQLIDSSENVWNGDFKQTDTLGSAKLNVVYNPSQKGYIRVLETDRRKLIWSQKIKVKPYSTYTFSFNYSYIGFGSAQPIPIQFYAGYNQWSGQISLYGVTNKRESFEFNSGNEEEMELALYFNTYGTFFPIPKPVVDYAITDISCIQSGWVWRLDSLTEATSYPKPIIQQEGNKLRVSPLQSNAQISWYHNDTLVGTHHDFDLGTSDSGNYVACTETKTLCTTCSDTFYAKRWNPLSIAAQNLLQWEVYPNPAEHEFYIRANQGVAISFYTIQGVCVYQETAKLEHTIPVGHLAPGIYILKGEVNGNSLQQKVIIQ